jgi:hypothetical protein
MEASAFLEFIRLVVAGDTDRVSRRLSAAPVLATTASPAGATRQQATAFFFTAISHYLYAGDTPLHMAAAAFSRPMAQRPRWRVLLAFVSSRPRAAQVGRYP